MSSGAVSVTVNNEILISEDDFWREAATKLVVVDDPDDSKVNNGNVTDEGEIEADWLAEVGLGDMSQQWRQGKSLPENDIGTAVKKLSLKPHQADAVRKRIRTLNATLKKRRKNQRRPPDVRNFFQNEYPENKDSSRSATPDSLDSSEFLNNSPPRNQISPLLMDNSIQINCSGTEGGGGDELHNQNLNQVPSFVSVFDHHNNLTQPSPKDKNKDIFKPQLRFQVRGNYNNGTEGEIATDDISGIEMLNYHNVGTVYMKGYLPPRKASQLPNSGPISVQHQPTVYPTISMGQNHTTNIEINSKTYTSKSQNISQFTPSPIPKNGFTEELNKRNNGGLIGQKHIVEDDILDENRYIDPSGQTRLSDLSEADVSNIRPILLMELTAQCDHLNIQIRRRKVSKSGKKSSIPDESLNNIFGQSLETLLIRDRKGNSEKVNALEVPIVLEKLVMHLWKNSLNEEGLLRKAGNKVKINELRAVFESSLYTEPEQVNAALNQCSSHDVANLLKQFIRELPLPLLGMEYIDTFYDVASQLNERNQENCLRLLVLLLPQSNQAALLLILEFLRDLIRNSEVNKMSLSSVATIIAPNLVSSSLDLRSQNKEINRAAIGVSLTQLLLRYGASLFKVPSDLLYQMRQINDLVLARNNKKTSKKSMGSNGVSGNRPYCNSRGGGVCSSLSVNAPQLGLPDEKIPINAGTTAGDIVLHLLEEGERRAENLEHEGNLNRADGGGGGGRRRGGGRGANGQGDMSKNGPNLSCLLTQVSKDMAFKAHSLYEVGGNIGYRRVDPLALIPAICRDNPAAAWVLRCNHRHSASV